MVGCDTRGGQGTEGWLEFIAEARVDTRRRIIDNEGVGRRKMDEPKPTASNHFFIFSSFLEMGTRWFVSGFRSSCSITWRERRRV